jgi:predicted transcriptional regulator
MKMSSTTSFSIDLDPDLRARFTSAAEASHRTAEDLILEFMKDYVERQHQDADYDAYLEEKVAIARLSIAAGRLVANEEVEKEFALLRSGL